MTYSDIILELSSISLFHSKEGHIGLGWSNGVYSYVRLKGQGIVCTMSGRDFQREQLGLKPCQWMYRYYSTHEQTHTYVIIECQFLIPLIDYPRKTQHCQIAALILQGGLSVVRQIHTLNRLPTQSPMLPIATLWFLHFIILQARLNNVWQIHFATPKTDSTVYILCVTCSANWHGMFATIVLTVKSPVRSMWYNQVQQRLASYILIISTQNKRIFVTGRNSCNQTSLARKFLWSHLQLTHLHTTKVSPDWIWNFNYDGWWSWHEIT